MTCECGCGRTTPIATRTRSERGEFKGQPKPFYGRHRQRATGIAASFTESYVAAPSGCWIWQRALSSGYGYLRVDGATVQAHRVSWERARGPIPAGMHVDHLCRTPACVNPDHLEVVTPKENLRRGMTVKHRPGTPYNDVQSRARQLAATGMPVRMIADRLGVDRHTVKRSLGP